MSFTTFRAESKAYMDYDRRTFWAKVRFWVWYPIAAAKFYWWTWQDSRRAATTKPEGE